MHARAFCPVLAVVCLAGAALASAQSADLMVTKSGPATADAGTNVTHAVTVTNLGPDDASTVTLQEAIPSGMTFVSWSQVDGPSYSCSTPPVGSGGTVQCTIATHPIAQPTADFSITLAIPAATAGGTVFTNIATSSSPSDQNSENDEGVAGTSVNGGLFADVGIAKTAPGNAKPGTNVTFSLALQNAGPNDAQTVSWSDPLPGTMTFVSLTQDSGPTFTCSTPAVGAGGTVSCSIATLAVGASATFSLVANVPANTPANTTFSNISTITTATDDPNSENDEGAAAVLVTAADMGVNKSGPASVLAGSTFDYTLTMSNGGPSTAAAATLTDPLPAGLTFVSLVQNSGPTATCSTPAVGAGGTVSCQIDFLASNASAAFTLTVKADPALAGGSMITNTATVSSANLDSNATNDSSGTTADVTAQADLAVVKAGPAGAMLEQQFPYEISVTNNGPSVAAGVTLSDTLPANESFVSLAQSSGPAFACNAASPVVCSIASLDPGAVATFELRVTTTGGTTVTNTATVTATTSDPDGGNNASSVTTALSPPIPALAPAGIALLVALLALAGAAALRRV